MELIGPHHTYVSKYSVSSESSNVPANRSHADQGPNSGAACRHSCSSQVSDDWAANERRPRRLRVTATDSSVCLDVKLISSAAIADRHIFFSSFPPHCLLGLHFDVYVCTNSFYTCVLHAMTRFCAMFVTISFCTFPIKLLIT